MRNKYTLRVDRQSLFLRYGSLWLWGHNGTGQLGDGTIASKAAPQLLGEAGPWRAIAGGDSFSVALHDNPGGGFAPGSGDGTTPETAFRIATPEHLDNVRNYLGAEHANKLL